LCGIFRRKCKRAEARETGAAQYFIACMKAY
jgi:hypothetical protein